MVFAPVSLRKSMLEAAFASRPDVELRSAGTAGISPGQPLATMSDLRLLSFAEREVRRVESLRAMELKTNLSDGPAVAVLEDCILRIRLS